MNRERTNWRDQWISNRHRMFGANLPCVDLDCLLTKEGEVMGEHGWNVIEYDQRRPRAIIEYKARGARVNLTDANNTTLKALAQQAGLPFFVVVYDKKSIRYGILPCNTLAENFCQKPKIVDEPGFIQLLHEIRQIPVLTMRMEWTGVLSEGQHVILCRGNDIADLTADQLKQLIPPSYTTAVKYFELSQAVKGSAWNTQVIRRLNLDGSDYVEPSR